METISIEQMLNLPRRQFIDRCKTYIKEARGGKPLECSNPGDCPLALWVAHNDKKCSKQMVANTAACPLCGNPVCPDCMNHIVSRYPALRATYQQLRTGTKQRSKSSRIARGIKYDGILITMPPNHTTGVDATARQPRYAPRTTRINNCIIRLDKMWDKLIIIAGIGLDRARKEAVSEVVPARSVVLCAKNASLRTTTIYIYLQVKEFIGTMRKTFQYRLYPTRKQTITLLHVLSVCRKLYNDTLHDRKVAYEDCHCGLSFYAQCEWLKFADKQGVYGHTLQNVLRRVDTAFQNFFRRVKNGEAKVGYPRFQGRTRYDSFTYPDAERVGSIKGGYTIEDGKLHLSKIGAIRIFQHRELEGKVKTCTIKRDGDQWYASFSVELPDNEPKEIKTSVGVDVGITTLATLSDGTEIENPKTLNKYDSKLHKAHRDLSRKKKGSSNRNRQRVILAGIYRKVRNARKDCLHKASRILADNYDRIVFEDLQIKNMVKNHHLARSIHDASWSTLINYTTYKAEYAGGSVELVNPRNTSKQCSVCGNIKPMPLSQRTYQCPDCGAVMGRDHNAAINIKNRYVPADCGKLTPVEMVA